MTMPGTSRRSPGRGLDAWGRIKGVQSADGGKEGYTYDYAGNITSTKDANGGVITYRYNSQGKVCEIIDQEGHSCRSALYLIPFS